ncbi:MAG: basic amino acid/polyamine antiporter [Muribaculaceae bacterium]|nr:basic amino acid/polyamine antiporter [Muribaculaceae bacterium]
MGKNKDFSAPTKGNNSQAQLGFWGLTAIVFGSVIGSSIFNIAQNMARNASLGAVIMAWLFTGAGMLFLVGVFKRLADSRPDLKAGIYQYAQVGFGNYIGFNMAWGYWLCVILGNVTYVAMLNESLASFFPMFHQHAWVTIAFGSALIWTMFFIVSKGIQSASFLNTLLAVIKFGCLILIIGVLIICCQVGMFTVDFWGHSTFPALGYVSDQFSSCMLVTIWSFMGIEGAVMMAGRARRSKDIGKATVTGFSLAIMLYVLVTVLCFGVMLQPQLAALPNPSLAYVLDSCAGNWAKWFVIVSVVVSLTGGFMAWTLVCAQVPFEAAKVGIFPRRFMRLNCHGVPSYGMMAASIAMTICLFLIVTADNIYIAALNLTSLMVLPPYLFTALYLLKITCGPWKNPHLKGSVAGNRIMAGAASLFCLYIFWSCDLKLLMATSMFYLAGTGFYILARRQSRGSEPIFTPSQLAILVVITICAVTSVALLATGNLRLDA